MTKKYRVWDKRDNRMYDWEQIKDLFSFDEMENDHLAWQQYTGLKDKSGAEIYEGDIVRGRQTFDEYWTGEVKYLAPYYAVLGSKSHVILDDLVGLEVIGNIFEHPNLLEVIA